MALVARRAMHVVEPVAFGNANLNRMAELFVARHEIELELDGPARGRGDRQREVVVSALLVPTMSAADLPRWVSDERRNAKRFLSASTGRWMLRNSSPG